MTDLVECIPVEGVRLNGVVFKSGRNEDLLEDVKDGDLVSGNAVGVDLKVDGRNDL